MIEIIGEENSAINGQGALWCDSFNYTYRPGIIRLVNCENIVIKNLLLIDSPFCAISLFNCSNVLIENVVIVSKWCGNNDGIDIDCCKDVVVRNCTLDTGDDSVAIKGTADVLSSNITVENCTITSTISAFKIGTESVGDFENITFKDSKIKGARFSAIKIVNTDGGKVNGVVIKNISMTNVSGPVFIANGERLKTYYKKGKETFSCISNVLIENVKADVVVFDKSNVKNFNTCFFVSGTKNKKIMNFTVKNCDMKMPGGEKTERDFFVDEMEKQYPEFYTLGLPPASCAYFRHVDGLKFIDNNFSVKTEDVRVPYVFEDVDNLEKHD